MAMEISMDVHTVALLHVAPRNCGAPDISKASAHSKSFLLHVTFK